MSDQNLDPNVQARHDAIILIARVMNERGLATEEDFSIVQQELLPAAGDEAFEVLSITWDDVQQHLSEV